MMTCMASRTALIGHALDSDLPAIANVPAVIVFPRLSTSIFATLLRWIWRHVDRVVVNWEVRCWFSNDNDKAWLLIVTQVDQVSGPRPATDASLHHGSELLVREAFQSTRCLH